MLSKPGKQFNTLWDIDEIISKESFQGIVNEVDRSIEQAVKSTAFLPSDPPAIRRKNLINGLDTSSLVKFWVIVLMRGTNFTNLMKKGKTEWREYLQKVVTSCSLYVGESSAKPANKFSVGQMCSTTWDIGLIVYAKLLGLVASNATDWCLPNLIIAGKSFSSGDILIDLAALPGCSVILKCVAVEDQANYAEEALKTINGRISYYATLKATSGSTKQLNMEKIEAAKAKNKAYFYQSLQESSNNFSSTLVTGFWQQYISLMPTEKMMSATEMVVAKFGKKDK